MAGLTQFSAENLAGEARVDPARWSQVPSEQEVAETAAAIGTRGTRVIRVKDRREALDVLVRLIPRGAEVMNGSSTTLIEIGYEDLLKSGKAGWVSLHDRITAENDAAKRAELRRKSVTADYFVSGANAIARTGEILACDRTGSRVGAWPFAAGRLILVSGTNKIVPTLEEALRRIREYAFPLENARAMRAYGTPSRIGKCVILANEEVAGRVTLILIDETLGY
ncbi:MAG TPA: lactate utilization protein [Methanomicrobiales archaeon]|jgi:L-lactate utilization protein LutB|nr:lactate utilization protein [Methanomicrobiales archaeon]